MSCVFVWCITQVVYHKDNQWGRWLVVFQICVETLVLNFFVGVLSTFILFSISFFFGKREIYSADHLAKRQCFAKWWTKAVMPFSYLCSFCLTYRYENQLLKFCNFMDFLLDSPPPETFPNFSSFNGRLRNKLEKSAFWATCLRHALSMGQNDMV